MRPQLSQVIISSPRRISAITCGLSDMKHAVHERLRASATATPSRMRALIRAYIVLIDLGRLANTWSRSAREAINCCDCRWVSSSKDFSRASRSELSVAISSARSLSAASALSRLSICSRSEEHTSELQSQSNLVCRLLLEKKKKYILDCLLTLPSSYPLLHFR